MATIRKLRGRWQAQVRRRGMKPRAKSFDSKAEAERWARELEAEVDRYGQAPDTRVLERTTFAQLLTRYKVEISPTKRGSVQEIERLDALLRHELAHRTLIGLTSSHFAAYRDERLRSVSPATVTRELAILSHVIEIARREWDYPLAANPVKAIKRPAVANARDRRVKPRELEQLLSACDSGRTPFLRALIVVAVETAMRRGELLALRWGDVDFDAAVATLHTSKNGDRRRVPLSTRALEALTSIRSDGADGPVFPLATGALEAAWQRLRVRANVTNVRLHDLRHEGVSRLFERGLNVMEVASISGHKELRMLSRYTHLRAEDLVKRLT